MFGCYRKGDANDPDTYVAAVTFVLTKYAPDIVKAVTDPYSGMPARKNESGWSGLPDVADVKQACEAEAEKALRLERLRAMPKFEHIALPKPIDNSPGRRANVFVASNLPQYPEILERTKTADTAEWRTDPERPNGIWVALSWVDKSRPKTAMKQPAMPMPTVAPSPPPTERNDDEIAA